MQIALDLAAKGQGGAEPNPMVGCVLVKDHRIIGQGFHERYGEAHAEVIALRSLPAESQAMDATAYVTLEPCSHHGKTPPCCETLIAAGIDRVVIAMADPFPQVDGRGIVRLREAGIKVDVGVLAEQAIQLNAPYLKRLRTKKPWVIAKWAMTMDGRLATSTGDSKWITSETARVEVHRLRSRVDGIAVGMGTVVTDDPTLTARGISPLLRSAQRIVYATHRLPSLSSNLVQTMDQASLVLVVPKTFALKNSEHSQHLHQLEHQGASVLRTSDANPAAMIDESLEQLAQRGMTNLLVEGGSELLASFLAANQIDEAHVFLGAKLFGGRSAMGPIAGEGVHKVADAPLFTVASVDAFDQDVRVIYHKKQCPA